jgi:tetratricopeptide (TPR) repeat protein
VVELGSEERANLRRWLDRKRMEIKRRRRTGVDPRLIEELGSVYQDLENRGEYVEALEVLEVTFQGLRYLKHPRARQELSYKVWRSKGVTSLWLGRHGDSIEAYEKAIEFGEKGAYANEKPRMPATNRRELGSMYWRVGAHSEALRNLSIAEGNLERDRAAIYKPEFLDELARIRAAFGLVYLDLGRFTDAAESAAEAARIHEELGEQDPQRFMQAAIAYTTLGNARREAAQELEADLRPAFAAFDDALRVLKRYPSRDEEYTDRESDIYLGRGRALLLDAEYETALQHLERSLSLASHKNIAQHAAAHYLYVGEAQAKSGRKPLRKSLWRNTELDANESQRTGQGPLSGPRVDEKCAPDATATPSQTVSSGSPANTSSQIHRALLRGCSPRTPQMLGLGGS